MKRTFHILKYIVLSYACSGLANAQEAVPYVSDVKMTFTCWNNEFEITYPGNTSAEPIIAPAQARSTQTSYSGPASFMLSKVTETEDGASSRQIPIADIHLPLDFKHVLVILIPSNAPNSDHPYRAIVINDDFEVFPLQSLRFLNFTSYKLAGQLGSNKFEIAARSEAMSQPDSTKGPKNLVPFRMLRYLEETGTWRPVRSTVFSMPANMRILVIILDDPNEPSLRFVMLRGLETGSSEQEIDLSK